MMASNDLSQEIQIQEDVLSCPICAHQLTQPKALPCQHTYCCTCLQQLAQRAENGRFACPECRKVVIIPAQGVQALPTNFFVLNILENVQKCRVEQDKRADGTDMCDTHKQEANVVCVTCKVLVCTTCLQSQHKEHELRHIDQEKNSIVREVRKCLESITSIKDPFESLTLERRHFQQNYKDVKQQIEARAAEIINTVNHQKDSLLEELEQREERKLGNIKKLEKQYHGSELMLQLAKTAAGRAIDDSNGPVLYRNILPQKSHLTDAVAKRDEDFAKFASLLEVAEKGGLKFEHYRSIMVTRQQWLGHIIEEGNGPSRRPEESAGPSGRDPKTGLGGASGGSAGLARCSKPSACKLQAIMSTATTSTGSTTRASALASSSRSRPDDAVPEATGSAASSGSGSNGYDRRGVKRPYEDTYVTSDEDD